MSRIEIVFVDDNGSAHRIHLGHGGEDVDSRVLQRLEHSLTELHRKVDHMTATQSQINALLVDMNAATNRVASRLEIQAHAIQDLTDRLANAGTISPEEQAALEATVAALTSEVSKLNELAANPDNPVPAEEPNPPVPGAIG